MRYPDAGTRRNAYTSNRLLGVKRATPDLAMPIQKRYKLAIHPARPTNT